MNLRRPMTAVLLLSSLLLADTNETNQTQPKVQTKTDTNIFKRFGEKFIETKDKVVQSIDNKFDEWMPNEYNGNWHIRSMDGSDVRAARAIVELDIDKMKLSGFDACNQIGGVLKKQADANASLIVPSLTTTKMACRQQIHQWTSARLHETLEEGFSITVAKQNGIEGIRIKSKNHELFLKKMGVEEEEEKEKDDKGWSLSPSSLNTMFNAK